MSVLILSVAWDTMFRWVIIVVSFTFSIKIVIQKQTIKKHLLSLFSLQSFSNFQRTVYTHVYLIVHIILEVSSQQRKSNSGSFTDARVESNHAQLQLVAWTGLAWIQDHCISNSTILPSFFITGKYRQLWSTRCPGGKNEKNNYMANDWKNLYCCKKELTIVPLHLVIFLGFSFKED